jgi:hypothetical protein
MKKIIRLFNTVKYLKFSQIYYRIYYKVRKKQNYKNSIFRKSKNLQFTTLLQNNTCYKNREFIFLNFSHKFEDKIDWNYNKYGKLWTYNLVYFDFLNQKDISKEEGLFLVHDFVSNIDEIKDGMEPFPISLRGINWIKFLSKYNIKNDLIDNSLYDQYMNLINNLEYHLLGNHLLENAFSLLFGAYYFQDSILYSKAKQLLVKELDEQILEDGGHFELSPMYHQIMLFRVLDCINLIKNNQWKDDELLTLLIAKAKIMLGWLFKMTFKNGNIPLFNDSTNNIAPTTDQLKEYSQRLGVHEKDIKLSESGYRKFAHSSYELIVDVGNIGPDYIPGHAHSDTFNFELYVKGTPLIVDTGLSTYETNERRTLERSTQSHNTVMINNCNQSEVWGGFRVAKRAKIIDIKENINFVKATHDGYKSNFEILHTRSFTAFEDKIVIEDFIDGNLENTVVTAYLHFYPGIVPIIKGQEVYVKDVKINIDSDDIAIHKYKYAPEFNKLITAYLLEIKLTKKLRMELII